MPVDRLAHGQAARRIGSEFPTGDALLTALGLLHLPMLTLAVWAISSAPYLIFPERIGLLIGFGLFFSARSATPTPTSLFIAPTGDFAHWAS